MKDIKDFYILGMPIETKIGDCHFLKVKEYPDYFLDLQTISLSKLQIINKYEESNRLKKDSLIEEIIGELKKIDLYTMAISVPELQESYVKVFTKVFNSDDILSEIDENNFTQIRKIVMDMNWVKEEEINPNPEIQRAIERSRRVKSMDGDKLAFADIVSSVVGYNGLKYQDINEFTVYQLYMTFYRIAQIKNYDTSTLFATVSSEKISIDSWSKHINFFEKENHTITKDELDSKSNSLFGSNK
jgi:hypothetical protein